MRHPFLQWIKLHNLSYRKAAELFLAHGYTKPNPEYLRQICLARRHPSYDMAKRIAVVSGGAISVMECMEFKKAV